MSSRHVHASVAVFVALSLLLAGAGRADVLRDITMPGDPNEGTSTNSPAGEPPWSVIDDDIGTKYLNFDKEGSGLTVTPSLGPASLSGIALTTANDEAPRDPASVTIEGTNDSVTWWPVVTNLATALPDERFVESLFAFTPQTAGDFATYRIVFPSLKDSGSANSMQIAEIRLLSGAPDPDDEDVTQPADTVAGSSDNHPDGELPYMAIDNDPTTKYLNFDKEGSGFTATMFLGPDALRGIALTTANDAPPRDPASVTILGSNDGQNWLPVATDLQTPLPDDRHERSEFFFTPETAGDFAAYQVIFPTLKDSANANSMQIGDVELLRVPEPGTLCLLALGALGALRRRRR